MCSFLGALITNTPSNNTVLIIITGTEEKIGLEIGLVLKLFKEKEIVCGLYIIVVLKKCDLKLLIILMLAQP